MVKIQQDTGLHELTQPNLDGNFRWYETEEGAAYPDHEGTPVFTRPDQTRATHALAMKANTGCPIVAEVDDNYLAPVKFNPYMKANYDANTYEEIKRSYAPFDRIIVTTQRLRDYFHKGLHGLGVRPVPEFVVCGNHVDPAAWPVRDDHDGPLRVGWMGSDSHFRDVKLAYPALKLAHDLGCQVVIIGYDPKWRPQTRISGLQQGESIGFDYEHIEWVDPRQWKRGAFPLDIAIAPLERNEFTLGKSDVKFLDYTMSGAATVASYTVYSDSIVHGETGLLGTSREELARNVHTLIRNPELRERLVTNAQQYVRENRLITLPQNLEPWQEAIRWTTSTQSRTPTATASSSA